MVRREDAAWYVHPNRTGGGMSEERADRSKRRLRAIVHCMRRDALPDPHDEREVSGTWLAERMRKYADEIEAMTREMA